MTPTQEAWRLLQYDWKRFWVDLLFTGIFSIVLGMGSAMFINGLIDMRKVSEPFPLNGLILDLYFILFIPMFTVVWAGREYWNPTKMRAMFDHRLLILRILPISTAGFVRSRVFQVIGVALFCSIAFFPAFYLVGIELRHWLNPGQFVLFASIWLGYGLAAGGIYPLLEWGSTRRWTYLTVSLLILLACVVPVFLHWGWTQISWVERTIQWAVHAPWSGPLALIIGLGVMTGWAHLLKRRLTARDLG